MLAIDTLVLMPCSATKRSAPSSLSCFDLYDGPLWQSLRLHKPKALPWGSVLVLSGKFGLVSAWERLPNYEARLSAQKADYLMKRGIMERNDRFGETKPGRGMGAHPYFEAANGRMYIDGRGAYRRVIDAGSGEYRRVFEWLVRELGAAGLIDPSAEVRKVSGGIGCQRSQLGQFLKEVA